MSYIGTFTADTDGSATDTLVCGAFTTSGTNRHVDVAVCIATSSATTVSSVSRGSETYAEQRADLNPTGSSLVRGSFHMSTTEPQTASAAMTVVISASRSFWGFQGIVADDVDQTTRLRGGVVTLNPYGDGAVSELAYSSAVGDLVVSAILGNSGTASTAVVGDGTLRGTWAAPTDGWGAIATAPGAATVTLDWNGSPFRFVHYAASHPPAGDATLPVLTVPGPQTGTMGTPKVITGFTASDTGSNIDTVTATCDAAMTITFDLTGTSVTDGSTNGTNSVSLSGSQADLITVLEADITVAYAESWPTYEDTVVMTLTVIDDASNQDQDTVSIAWTSALATFLTGSAATIISNMQALEWTPPTDATGNFNMLMVSETSNALSDSDQFQFMVEGEVVAPVLTVPGTQHAAYDATKAIGGVSVAHAGGDTISLLFECPAAMTMNFDAGATGATITGDESSSVLIEDTTEADLSTVAGSLIVSRATPVTPVPSDLVAESLDTYTVETNLQVSDTVYNDRTYTFTSIPTALLGATWIQTPNDDKASSAADCLVFTLNAPAWVYVTYDERALETTTLPSWLSTWELLDDVIEEDQDSFGYIYLLFRKSFPAGTGVVTLGGYNFGLLYSHYTVIILPIAATIPIAVTATDSVGEIDVESFNVAWSVTGAGGGVGIPNLIQRRRRKRHGN